MSMNNDPHDVQARESALEAQAADQRITSYLNREDLKWLMSDKRGRRFMWQLLSVTGAFRNPFAGEQTNLAMFRMGEQNVGQRYIAELHEHCPTRYETMLTENRK